MVVMRVQQILFEVESEYFGHPYYVTGNALYQAIAQRVDAATRQALCVSHGVFFPGEYGSAPSWCSQAGSLGKLGSELPPVESYDDLFLVRDAAHRWLKSSRPRDAHNVQPLQTHGGRVTVGSTTWFGRPPEMRASRRGVRWFVQCYVHAESSSSGDVLPVASDALDGIQVGGGRNYGFGLLSHVDSQVIELDKLCFDRLKHADEHVIELVSPFVTETEFPSADGQSVPWWWDVTTAGAAGKRVSGAAGDESRLRRRTERLVVDGTVYDVQAIDHGQIVGYDGDDAVGTARNGVLRVGTHARYGYGEFRVRPVGDDRVPEREGESAVA